MTHIACDVHTHTLFSRHAYSTIEENVRAAAERGIEVLGSTDHFGAMLFDEQSLRNFQFFLNNRTWPRLWHGVRVLHGCEADIVDGRGHLFGWDVPEMREITDPRPGDRTLQERVFEQADYVIASVHSRAFSREQTRTQNTQTYIDALQQPKVLILGHVGRSGVDFEFGPVLEAARDLGKLVEINGATMAAPRPAAHARCREVIELAAEVGCALSFGSDAHVSARIGQTAQVEALFDELGVPERLNACRSAEAFLQLREAALGPLPDDSPL